MASPKKYYWIIGIRFILAAMPMKKTPNEALARLSVASFKASAKLPVAVLLDNVRSLNNVGSAFRTLDAFRFEKIYLAGITGTPPNREIHKTALGATDSVAWEHVKDPASLLRQLRSEGYQNLAVEQAEPKTLLQNFTPQHGQKYCLVFGNEVFGVSEQALEACDGCLEIPQHGTKHSLNIAVAMGIVAWDFYCKLGGIQP